MIIMAATGQPGKSLMLPDHEYHLLRVAEVIDETADTRSFVLDIPPALQPAFAYTAGQFCTFRATIDGESVVRSYSMSSSPDTGDPFTTTVKRVPSGRMSNWMNDALTPGDSIEVMRPTGLFVLRPSDAPIVAFAGGSGVTPVISVVKSALATTSRAVTLVYANRDRDAVIFADEFDRLARTYGERLSVHHHLDSERSFLDAAQCAALAGDRAHADFYICGPGPYMETVEAGLALLGVDASQVSIERFVTPDAIPVETNGTAPDEIAIRLDRKKQTIRYHRGDTVLEAARRGGLRPPFSCEAGNCATCMAHLDKGSVTMRVNNALSADEVDEGWILTCQSIPTSAEVAVNYDA
jgi:3-ketosteroid 9alpha-monooxygenase subunit B